MRKMNVRNWREPSGTWIRINNRAQHTDRQSYLSGSLSQAFGIVLAFVSTNAAIVAAILAFADSKLRYRPYVTVNQGGVITYGKTSTTLSNDMNNQRAGTPFSVAHWYVAQVEIHGYKGFFPAVCTIYMLLALWLIRMVYIFSLRREHKLDRVIFQYAVLPIQWTIQVPQALVLRVAPIFRGYLSSYETTFKTIYKDLCIKYDQPYDLRAIPSVNLFNRYKFELYIEGNIIANPVADPALNGEEPTTSNSSGVTEMDVLFRSTKKEPKASVNDIQKAAEVLAADAFGRLTYVQALTLMSGTTLTKIMDMYFVDGTKPSVEEVKQLALIYYVQEAIVPKGAGSEINRNDFRIVDMDKMKNPIENERPEYCNKNKSLVPILG
eukprot:IDg1985t1